MSKKRSQPGGGHIDRGRYTFCQSDHECIRTVIRVKIAQVQRHLAVLDAAAIKVKGADVKGQREYWATVLSWLNGWYRGGTASVDAIEWMVEYQHVTTVERHKAQGTAADQQAIPGMED